MLLGVLRRKWVISILATELKAEYQLLLFFNGMSHEFSVCVCVCVCAHVSVQALCACARVYLYEPPRSGGISKQHGRGGDGDTLPGSSGLHPLCVVCISLGDWPFLPETMLPLMSRSDPHVRGGHFLGPLQHPGCCCPLNRRPTEQPDGWGLASMGDPRA